MLRVDIMGDDRQGIQRVHTHAPLKATTRMRAQQSAHPGLVGEIFRVLVDMGKTVDLFSGTKLYHSMNFSKSFQLF